MSLVRSEAYDEWATHMAKQKRSRRDWGAEADDDALRSAELMIASVREWLRPGGDCGDAEHFSDVSKRLAERAVLKQRVAAGDRGARVHLLFNSLFGY